VRHIRALYADHRAVLRRPRDVNVVMGGDISVSSIGRRLQGFGVELSNTVFDGHANKGHDGFVGHSYVGRWVQSSAPARSPQFKEHVWKRRRSGRRPAFATRGMQFLGTLFGDHVKTGIGLRLTTGTVLGAGRQRLSEKCRRKRVAPFSWGDAPPYATTAR
jgi:hypothetical protein